MYTKRSKEGCGQRAAICTYTLVKKRSLVAAIVLLSLLTLLTTGASAADITVCASGCDYTTIQAAVDAANPGDTIIVHDGTYTENVLVNKRLTIQSLNGALLTTVQAASASDHVFNVTADHVTISGFTVTGAATNSAGIYLYHVNNCTISNNTASDNYEGIRLTSCNDNTLTGNTAYSNSYSGIWLSSSSNNTLTNNTASNTTRGIRLYFSSNNNTLTGNTANSNDFFGIRLYSSSYNSLTGNTANSNDLSGIHLDSSSYNTLTGNTATSNNQSGIALAQSSTYNTLTGNTASNNTYSGIVLTYSSTNNTLIDNTVSDNANGISTIWSSNYNTIANNTANSNRWYGISLGFSSNSNNLTGNTANTNGYGLSGSVTELGAGIHLSRSSTNNTLTGNTVSNNTGTGINLRHAASNNTITCNWIHSNSQYGLYLFNGSTGNTIAENNILANGVQQDDCSWHYNLYNDQNDSVIAENNYWGTKTDAVIAASINEHPGTVDYEPFLSFPALCAPLETFCLSGYTQNESGVGLANWTINVTSCAGAMSSETNESGYWEVCALIPGLFTVCAELQEGWSVDDPASGCYENITIIGTSITNLNFTIRESVYCLSGYKLNESGVGLANWTITVMNSTGALVAANTTDGTGYWLVCGLPPGTYTVCEVRQPGWLIDDPASTSGCHENITLIETEITNLNFTNRQEVGQEPCIELVKWINGEDSATAEPGDTLVITLWINNCGNVNLTNLSVRDNFPLKQFNAGLSYAAGTANPADDGGVSGINETGWIAFAVDWWGNDPIAPGHLLQFEPLAPGANFTITFEATVDDLAEGAYDNCATVTADFITPGQVSGTVNATDCATVVVAPPVVQEVPLLTPTGLIALVSLLAAIAVLSVSRKRH